jgi:hypothetical protein
MLNRAKSTTAAPVHAVTTEKLLEASLTTLETMGRHMHVAGTQSILMGNEHDGMWCAVLGTVKRIWVRMRCYVGSECLLVDAVR